MTPDRPRPRLLEPSRIRPVTIDLRRVFWAGTAMWAAALVVSFVGWQGGTITGRTVATCVAGVVLGLAAVAWERRRRAREQSGPVGGARPDA